MLHTCFVIYYDIWIMILILGKLSLKQAVYITVATLSLCSAHYEQIKIIFLNQCILKSEFSIICLGHSFRNRAFLCDLCLCDLLTYITESCVNLYSQDFVQVGIRICINCKDRSFILFAEILDQHST